MPTEIVNRLRALYQQPHFNSVGRDATLAPLRARVHRVRHAHARLVADHADLARAAATLNAAQLARYVRRDVLPLVTRLISSAHQIINHGDMTDLRDAFHAAECRLDVADAREFDYLVQNIEKFLVRAEQATAQLEQAAGRFRAAHDALVAVEGDLAAPAVNVPEPVVKFTAI